MAKWQDFMDAIRQSNDQKRKQSTKGGFVNSALNVADTVFDTSANAARYASQASERYFAPVASDNTGYVKPRTRDFIRELPGATVDVGAAIGNFGADLGQSIARGAVGLGKSVAQTSDGRQDRIQELLDIPEDERKKLADAGDDPNNEDSRAIFASMARRQLKGDISDKALRKRISEIDTEENTDERVDKKNKVAAFFLGSEKDEGIQTVQKRNADIEAGLEKKGVNEDVASGLAVAGAAGLTALDTPAGSIGSIIKGIGKDGVALLAKANTDDAVKAVLQSRFPSMAEDAMNTVASKIAATTDTKEITKALKEVGTKAYGLTAKPQDMIAGVKETFKGAPKPPAQVHGIVTPSGKPVQDSYGEASDELLGRLKSTSEAKSMGPRTTKEKVFENIDTQWHDKFSPVNRMVHEIEQRTGKKLKTEDNPYALHRLSMGMPDVIKQSFGEMENTLAQAPDLNSVRLIGMARQIISRGERGITSTVTPERARQIIEEQRSKLGDEGFDQVANVVDSVQAHNQRLLKSLHDEGIISDQALQAIEETGGDYFAKMNVLQKVLTNDQNRALFAATGSTNVTANSIKKVLASATGQKEGTELLDPLESLFRGTERTMNLIDHNQTWKAYQRLSKEAPDLVVNIRDPEDVVKSIGLKSEIKEMVPVRNKIERVIKTRSKSLRRLESQINQLEKKGLTLSLKKGGQRMDQTPFSPSGLGGDVPTSQTGKNVKQQDFTTDAAGTTTKGSDAERITALGRQRDQLNKRADDQRLPEAAPDGTSMLRPVSDFADALAGSKATAKKAQGKQDAINDMLQAGRSGVDGVVTDSKLGAGDTGSFVRNLIENGSRADIDRIKKMVDRRDVKMHELLDEIGNMKSQYDEAKTAIIGRRNEIKELADDVVPEGYALISGFDKGVQGKLAVPQEVADVFTGKTKAQQDMFTGLFGSVNKFVKQNFTSNNPAFALITNPIRDAKSFAYNAKDVKADPYSIGKALVGGLVSRFKQDETYQRFIASGGKSGFYSTDKSAEDMVRDLKREVNGSKILGIKINPIEKPTDILRAAGRIANTPFRALQGAASVLEDAPRVAQFKASTAAGASDRTAALNARNVTVDFSQSGAAGQVANAWIPFLNPRLQGTIKSYEAIKRNPARAAAVYATLTAAPILAAAANNQRFPEVMSMIPDDTRENNFVIVLGDHKDENGDYDQVFKIPKSDIDKTLGNPLEQFARFWANDDPKSIQETITSMIGSVLPVDTVKDGNFSATRLVGGLLPPLLKAPVEAVTNKNLYFDSPVVPDSKAGLPDNEQVREDDPNTKEVERSTSTLARVTAPVLGGGSPMVAENTIRNFAGSLPTENPLKTIGGKLNGSNDGKMTSEFYNIIKTTSPNKKSASNHINDAIASGDIDEARETAEAYNSYLREQFAEFGETYGSRMTPELAEIYDKQKISLTPRTIKQRRREQIAKQTAE